MKYQIIVAIIGVVVLGIVICFTLPNDMAERLIVVIVSSILGFLVGKKSK